MSAMTTTVRKSVGSASRQCWMACSSSSASNCCSGFIVAGVGDGAQQPGLERSAAIGVDGAEGGDEGFLRGIGGRGLVAEDTQRSVEDRVLIMKDKGVEGV